MKYSVSTKYVCPFFTVNFSVVAVLVGLTDCPDPSNTSVSLTMKVTFPFVELKRSVTAPGLAVNTAGSEVAVSLQPLAEDRFPMSHSFQTDEDPGHVRPSGFAHISDCLLRKVGTVSERERRENGCVNIRQRDAFRSFDGSEEAENQD